MVVLGAHRLDRAESFSADPSARGGEALAVGTDVTDLDQVKRLVDTEVQTYGRIDVCSTTPG